MIERHQDYILTIPSIAAGSSALNQQLGVELDAPFMWRAKGVHIPPPVATRSQADVSKLRFQWRNAAGTKLSAVPIPAPQDFANAYGFGGNYRAIYPQQPFPPGGLMEVDVYNDSADTLTNVQVIFRGSKLFGDGTEANPTYPARCRALDFTYQSGKGTNADPAIVLNPTGAGSIVQQQQFQVNGDADFAISGLQVGLWAPPGSVAGYSAFGYTELYIQLQDNRGKFYSNAPIHVDWLAGNAGQTDIVQNNQLGNAAPGLLVPEIYIPRNGVMYFSIQRQDGPYTGVTDSLPLRVVITWIGRKVYAL
jgi:hypothetical protein